MGHHLFQISETQTLHLGEDPMDVFSRLTALDYDDLDQHAASFAAGEYAYEAADLGTKLRRFVVADQLRQMEEGKVHDDLPAPELDHLMITASIADAMDGDTDNQAALSAFRKAIDEMVSKITIV